MALLSQRAKGPGISLGLSMGLCILVLSACQEEREDIAAFSSTAQAEVDAEQEDSESAASSNESSDGAEEDAGEETNDSASDPEEEEAPQERDPQGPIIERVETTVSEISEGDTVVFHAWVTDPDGEEDLKTGWLKTADGSKEYTEFTRLQDGSYALETSWNKIHDVSPIDFDGDEENGGGEKRNFSIVFHDRDGNETSQQVSLGLYCPDSPACNGKCTEGVYCADTCVDLESDNEHCGECGNSCSVVKIENQPEVGGCKEGECRPSWSECAQARNKTCDDICEKEGKSCRQAGCNGQTLISWGVDPRTSCEEKYAHTGGGAAACDAEIQGVNNGAMVRCCCE